MIKELGTHIVSDPEIKGGAPTIRNTRLTVHGLAARLNGGECVDDVLEDYPYISYAQLKEAVAYAKKHPETG